MAVRNEQLAKPVDQLFLGGPVEIDHHIATEDQLEGLGVQVALDEVLFAVVQFDAASPVNEVNDVAVGFGFQGRGVHIIQPGEQEGGSSN